MQTSPVIVVLPVLMPMAAGAIDESGNAVRLLDQVREFHRDARALGTFPADPSPATDYGRQCAADAVKLAREHGRSAARRIARLA